MGRGLASAELDRKGRLLEGMVHVASRHGYGGSSVTRVIEAAGVSRTSFYEHFRSKEECFLAAYRGIARRMRERVRGAAEQSSPRDRPRAVLEELCGGVAEDPDAARLVLIEALGASQSIRVEHEALIVDTEAAIERFLAVESEGVAALQIPVDALLGGVAGVLSMRVFDRDTACLAGLVEDLLAWVGSYELPPGGRRWGESEWDELGRCLGLSPPSGEKLGAPTRLPRGASALPGQQAAALRRERILDATARLVRVKGYAAATVDDIAAAARVSRGAFYSQFRGKEEAFLAAQTVGLRESIAAAASEFFVAPSWPDQVWNAAVAMLGYVAAHPDLAFLEMVEPHAVGDPAIQRLYDNRMAYALFLEDGYRQPGGRRDLPHLCSEAIAGAILGLMRRKVLQGRTSEMLDLTPRMVYIAVAPFVGPTRAMELIEAKARSAR